MLTVRPIAKAEDIGRAEAGGKTAVSGAAGSRPLAEASVVPGEESGKCGVGPFKGADVGQSQLLAEAVLKGAPEALDPALGLRRAGADPLDVQLLEDPPDLSWQAATGELFFQSKRLV